MPHSNVDVVYALGWDAATTSVVHPLTPAEARTRDESGTPYVVLLVSEGRLRLAVEVAWTSHAIVVWRLDEVGRRDGRRELRLLEDGRLFLLQQQVWGYTDTDQPEFDATASVRTLRYHPDGRAVDGVTPSGGGGGYLETHNSVDPARLWERRPTFGHWSPLVAPMGAVEDDARLTEVDELPPPLSLAVDDDLGWTAPRPHDPSPYLEAMLQAGSRFRFQDGPLGEAVVELLAAPELVLRSGRLVAADPTWLQDQAAYDVRLPNGSFAVTLSVIRFVDDPQHMRVAAARLDITDATSVTWELALRPGQSIRLLGDREIFGFGVDAGLGCFVDAEAVEAATELIAWNFEMFADVDPEHPMQIDLGGGRTMVVFPSGWGDGSYPCWIGRSADGSVACVVADLLVVSDAELLTY